MARFPEGVLLSLGLAGVLLGARGVAAGPLPEPWTEIRGHGRQVPGLPDLAGLVQRSMPAVVSISVEQQRAPPPEGQEGADPLRELVERFYGDEPVEGLGAGFIIHKSGLILTNSHVVENAARIRVTIDGGTLPLDLPARIVGRDQETDIALLRVDAGKELPVLPLGDSDVLRVADWVVAIGNPFGLTQSVSLGIVSQKGRTDVTPVGREGYFDFIQTDASMNPGSSGGPLLNLRGEVVAINNAINAAGQGIGFAVPINMAKVVIPQLAANGRVNRGWIGLAVQDVLPEEGGTAAPPGVVVSEIVPGGPAAAAGLQVGDVILRSNGERILGAHRLRWGVACSAAGSPLAMEVLRDGKRVRVAVTPEEEPANTPAEATSAIHFLGSLGVAVVDADGPSAPAGTDRPTPAGARVVELSPDSVAQQAGLRVGDLLVGLGKEQVSSAEQLATELAGLPTGAMVELRVRRGVEEGLVALRKP